MALTVYTTQLFKYRYHDGVDITRSGATTTKRQGIDAPGAIWAPSAELVYPAVERMKACRALMKAGTTMGVQSYVLAMAAHVPPVGELSRHRQVPHEVHRDSQREAAYDKMAVAMEQIITNWSAYVDAFMIEMRHSWKVNRAQWNAFLTMDQVTLLCRCEDAAHCHRRILRNIILPALGAIDGGEHHL